VKSIRLYLIFALLAAVTLGNFVAAVYGYRKSMDETAALLDAQLDDIAALLLTMRPAHQPVSTPPSERLAFQIWSNAGKLVQRSANSSREPIAALEEGYRDVNFEGFRWRVLTRFEAPATRGHDVLVGSSDPVSRGIETCQETEVGRCRPR